VFGVMEGWMEEQLRGQAVASAAAGDESNMIRWKEVLATMHHNQGSNDKTVMLFEADLKYRRRVLPENHPDIGAT
jgi:hypothetical protein